MKHQYQCSGCKQTPIMGVRYLCSVRKDYNLCEKCEHNIQPPYPMLKIRNPENTPVYFEAKYTNHP